jgi:hypothetical protein
MTEKILKVDWDDPVNILQLISNLHSRHRELTNFKSKREQTLEKLSIALQIWETPIEIKDASKSLDKDFYLYIHYYKPSIGWPGKKNFKNIFCQYLGMSGIPFYVGKGCNDRIKVKKRNSSHSYLTRTISEQGCDFEVQIFKDNLTEQESLILEGKIIDILGQTVLKNGPLTNIDPGYRFKERRKMYETNLKELYKIYGPII